MGFSICCFTIIYSGLPAKEYFFIKLARLLRLLLQISFPEHYRSEIVRRNMCVLILWTHLQREM